MVPGQRAGSGKAAAGFRSPRAFGQLVRRGWLGVASYVEAVSAGDCDGGGVWRRRRPSCGGVWPNLRKSEGGRAFEGA
jgi:hypothetical protein